MRFFLTGIRTDIMITVARKEVIHVDRKFP